MHAITARDCVGQQFENNRDLIFEVLAVNTIVLFSHTVTANGLWSFPKLLEMYLIHALRHRCTG